MKKIISCHKYGFILLSFFSIVFLVFSLIGLGFEIFGLVEERGAGFFACGIFLCLFFILLCVFNRFACVVWIENNTVKRKGLIYGFYKEIPVSSIKGVIIQRAFREGDFIYLIDASSHKFDRTKNDSYICFCKTKKNLKLLRTFWTETIANEE